MRDPRRLALQRALERRLDARPGLELHPRPDDREVARHVPVGARWPEEREVLPPVELDADVKQLIDEAVAEAIAAPFPPDTDVTKNVYINY